MTDQKLVTFRESEVPLEGVDETVEEVVELYGGRVEQRTGNSMIFTLPGRRGVSGAPGFECTVRWDGPHEGGVVELSVDREVIPSRAKAVVLLGFGTVGAVLALMWPFFPQMAGLSGVGAIMAIAVFLLTLRLKPGGVAAELLERIAESQRELEGEGAKR